MGTNTELYRSARDQLVEVIGDYDKAVATFEWPRLTGAFNWATDWFDVIARDNDRTALWIVEQDGSEQKVTFAQMADRSDRVATWLRSLGVGKGDRVILMLGNQVELWESMLAVAKLGAIIMPTTGALGAGRSGRPHLPRRRPVRHRECRRRPRNSTRSTASSPGWSSGSGAATRLALLRRCRTTSRPSACDPQTTVDDPLLIYFTSGTTSRPKLVEHSQISYPVGHLSTMAWIGSRPGDVHLAISSPGWAKHAWSCFFAPWIAEATIFVYNYSRFDAAALLAQMRRAGVTTFCAPPTVWRMLIQADLGERPAGAAGSPGRRRTAQSRGDRGRAAGMGTDHPRRLRADRDHPADRQHARAAGEGGLDGPADAGGAGGAGRPAHR